MSCARIPGKADRNSAFSLLTLPLPIFHQSHPTLAQIIPLADTLLGFLIRAENTLPETLVHLSVTCISQLCSVCACVCVRARAGVRRVG